MNTLNTNNTYNQIKTNIKMKVTPEQNKLVQEICFANGIYWAFEDKDISYTEKKYLYIKSIITFGDDADVFNVNPFKEVSADLFIETNGTCIENTPIINLAISDVTTKERLSKVAELTSTKECDVTSTYSNEFEYVYFNRNCYLDWAEQDLSSINHVFMTYEEFLKEYDPENTDVIEIEIEIEEGTIVKATRTKDDFKTTTKYYGKFKDKYLVDFNGTHCMVVDEVEIIPTITKKEAKQKVSELFGGAGKHLSSQSIRDIIDLIEE